MEQAATLPKRRGNPNFVKKLTEQDIQEKELKQQYVFQLLQTHEKQKPRDGKTGEMVNSPYQPFFAEVNSGLAWDATYKAKGSNKEGGPRRWRYLYNYPTIWVDEQIDPEPSSEDLASAENDIIFRYGVLRVFGHQPMKLKALQMNDAFQECERPMKNVPARYQLLDQDKIDKEVLAILDGAFEAEKSAREATLQEMYALAYYYGIDLAKSDDAIRKEFITKARQNPTTFNKQFVNPKNKYKYVFACALADNIISGTIVAGCVYLVEPNTKVFDLRTEDIAEELAQNCMVSETKAMELYNQISKDYI